MLPRVLVCVIVTISCFKVRADDEFEVIAPCFELFNNGKCGQADFDGAIQCIDDLEHTQSFDHSELMGLQNIRKMFKDNSQQCYEWIYGSNPNLYVVIEPCEELYDKGQCEAADFDGAIRCVRNIQSSGVFQGTSDIKALADYVRVYQIMKERCQDQSQ